MRYSLGLGFGLVVTVILHCKFPYDGSRIMCRLVIIVVVVVAIATVGGQRSITSIAVTERIERRHPLSGKRATRTYGALGRASHTAAAAGPDADTHPAALATAVEGVIVVAVL